MAHTPRPHDSQQPLPDQGIGLSAALSDEFAARLRAGDQEALGEVFDAYFPRIWSFMRRSIADIATAEDLTQDTFVRILGMLPRYYPKGPFSAWIFAVASNQLVDHWRAMGVRSIVQSTDTSTLGHVSGVTQEPSKELQNLELHSGVERALATLPPSMRIVAKLRLHEGLELREIAEVLGLSDVAVRKRLSRGLKHLRAALECGPLALVAAT